MPTYIKIDNIHKTNERKKELKQIINQKQLW